AAWGGYCRVCRRSDLDLRPVPDNCADGVSPGRSRRPGSPTDRTRLAAVAVLADRAADLPAPADSGNPAHRLDPPRNPHLVGVCAECADTLPGGLPVRD